MNKKGLTLIELIITIALVSVIMVFLYKLLATVNFESKSDFIDTADRETRVEIIRTIQDELITFNSKQENTAVYVATNLPSNNKVEITAPTAASTKYEIEIPDDLKTLNFYKITGTDTQLVQSWKLKNGKFEAISNTTCTNKNKDYNEGVTTKKLYLMECDFKVFTENYNNKISSNGFNSNNTLDDIIITLTNYNVKNGEEEVIDPDAPIETEKIFNEHDTLANISDELFKKVIEENKEHGDDNTNEYVKFYKDSNRVSVGMTRTLQKSNFHTTALQSKYGNINIILANKTMCETKSSKRTDCGLIFIGKTTINGKTKIKHKKTNYKDEVDEGAYKGIFDELAEIIKNYYQNIDIIPVDLEYGMYFSEDDAEQDRYGTMENQKIYLLSAVEVTGNVKINEEEEEEEESVTNQISTYCTPHDTYNGICNTDTKHRSLDIFDEAEGSDINTWLRDITTKEGTLSSAGYRYEYKNENIIENYKINNAEKEFYFAFRLI